MTKLVRVTDDHIDFLYALLSQRTAAESISHRKMPSERKHRNFVRSRPYAHWYVIESQGYLLGAIYLTRRNEIGLHIRVMYRGQGFGGKAVRMLMKKHPRERYLANISVSNGRSMIFFGKLGFKPLQHTYELRG